MDVYNIDDNCKKTTVGFGKQFDKTQYVKMEMVGYISGYDIQFTSYEKN